MMRKALHIETPLIESTLLSNELNKKILLKMESSQPTGSFKIRGLGRLSQEYAKSGARCLICPSGGNAGLATAYAAKKLKLECIIVLPHKTPSFLKRIIEAEGATVMVFGESWDDADLKAQELANERGAYYVHPFNHPIIWEGNSTIIDEVYRSGIMPDAIVLSVGGGGLLAGVIEGLRRVGWSHIPIIAAETRGADSLKQSLEQSKNIMLQKIESIAVTLGCKQIAEHAFVLAQEHELYSVVKDDINAVSAALRFADDHRVIVEPACGVTLSILYDHDSILNPYHSVLVIVCGGTGVSYPILQTWHHELINKAKEK